MIGFEEELSRLLVETPGKYKPTDKSLIPIHIDCPLRDASMVLFRTKSLLEIVFRYRMEQPWDEATEPPDPFSVDAQYWLSVLPDWFLENTYWNSSAKASGVWTVEAWLYWFIHPEEDRAWRWWAASVNDDRSIDAFVDVDEIPFPWSALQWAFIAAGAANATLDF